MRRACARLARACSTSALSSVKSGAPARTRCPGSTSDLGDAAGKGRGHRRQRLRSKRGAAEIAARACGCRSRPPARSTRNLREASASCTAPPPAFAWCRSRRALARLRLPQAARTRQAKRAASRLAACTTQSAPKIKEMAGRLHKKMNQRLSLTLHLVMRYFWPSRARGAALRHRRCARRRPGRLPDRDLLQGAAKYSGSEFWFLPACNPFGLELTAGGNRIEGEHNEILQTKFLFKAARAERHRLRSLARLVRRRPVFQRASPASHSSTIARGAREPRLVPRCRRHLGPRPGGAALRPRLYGILETYGQHRETPTWHYGLRFWVIPESLPDRCHARRADRHRQSPVLHASACAIHSARYRARPDRHAAGEQPTATATAAQKNSSAPEAGRDMIAEAVGPSPIGYGEPDAEQDDDHGPAARRAA